MKRRAIFLDRDGVINKPKKGDYVRHWGEFEFLPRVASAIKKMQSNFKIVVVTNQGGVSRGILDPNKLIDIHKNMRSWLKKKGAMIDKIYVCPHYIQDNCQCRKPKPGLLLQAAKDLNIDLKESYMVGDRFSDVQAGKEAGCKTIFLGNIIELENVTPDFIAKDISEIPNIIS